ncbi:Protein tweety [Lamellibrachia satsuma]|nr:Protein tweety [Lamellibrachia satsuma]
MPRSLPHRPSSLSGTYFLPTSRRQTGRDHYSYTGRDHCCTGRIHCRTGRGHWPSSPKQAEITQAEIPKGRDHCTPFNRWSNHRRNDLESTFQPKDQRYLEALVFWAAVPVAWLLLTLLLFLVYFCYRCCQRDVEKKKKVPCLRWGMVILAICTCAAVGMGVYGNEDAKNGVQEFTAATKAGVSIVVSVRQEVLSLGQGVNNTIDSGIDSLDTVFMNPRLNRSIQVDLNRLTVLTRGHANTILTRITGVKKSSKKFSQVSSLIGNIHEYGFYRWLSMLSLLCWVVLLCLVLFLGIIRSSKCTLLVFCALGIFTMVLCWMVASVHFGVSVGLSDFCVAPDEYVESLAKKSTQKDILKYYLDCQPGDKSPFKQQLKGAFDGVIGANHSLAQCSDLALKVLLKSEFWQYVEKVSAGLRDVEQRILRLQSLMECTHLNDDYVNAVNAACYSLLPGIIFVLLSLVITGLLLTVLVVMASRAWRNFGKRKRPYPRRPEDESLMLYVDDASVSHYSFTRGRHGNPREHMSMQRRNTPPPAYNSNEFYRQYKAINQTPPEQPHHLTAADYEIQHAPNAPTPEQQRRFAAMDYNRETNA